MTPERLRRYLTLAESARIDRSLLPAHAESVVPGLREHREENLLFLEKLSREDCPGFYDDLIWESLEISEALEVY